MYKFGALPLLWWSNTGRLRRVTSLFIDWTHAQNDPTIHKCYVWMINADPIIQQCTTILCAYYIERLVRERRNSSALAMESRLTCTKPSIRDLLWFPSIYLGNCKYLRFITEMKLKMKYHNSDVIMIAMAAQITSLTIVYTIVYSVADQRKHQSSA